MTENKFIQLIKHPVFLLCCRVFLGVVFIYASFYKIYMPAQFARAVYNYQLMPDFLINIWALFLPALEIVCGLFLIIGFNLRGTSFIVSGLLVIFMIAISLTLFRGIEIDCGCFGPNTDGVNLVYDLFRDLGYLLISLPILFFYENKFSLDNLLKRN